MSLEGILKLQQRLASSVRSGSLSEHAARRALRRHHQTFRKRTLDESPQAVETVAELEWSYGLEKEAINLLEDGSYKHNTGIVCFYEKIRCAIEAGGRVGLSTVGEQMLVDGFGSGIIPLSQAPQVLITHLDDIAQVDAFLAEHVVGNVWHHRVWWAELRGFIPAGSTVTLNKVSLYNWAQRELNALRRGVSKEDGVFDASTLTEALNTGVVTREDVETSVLVYKQKQPLAIPLIHVRIGEKPFVLVYRNPNALS